MCVATGNGHEFSYTVDPSVEPLVTQRPRRLPHKTFPSWLASMFSCKDISRVVSESFERPLSFGERTILRIHLVLCGTCRKFRKLQNKIHSAVKKHGADVPEGADSPDDTPVLPDDSRSRIRIAIQKATEEPDKT